MNERMNRNNGRIGGRRHPGIGRPGGTPKTSQAVWWIGVFLLAVCGMIPGGLKALSWENYSRPRHDRFYPGSDRQFLADPMNLSAIGRVNGLLRWATLITPRHFISAAHFHPEPGDKLIFYSTNRRAGAKITRTVVSGANVSGADLWVGELDSAVDATIEPMAVMSVANHQIYRNCVALPVGFVATDGFAIGVGLTAIELTSEGASIHYLSDTEGILGDDKISTIVGDSGGPCLLVANGRPLLAGVHSGVNADVGVGYYLAALQALTGGETVQVGGETAPDLTAVRLTVEKGVWKLSVPNHSGWYFGWQYWDEGEGWKTNGPPAKHWQAVREWEWTANPPQFARVAAWLEGPGG